MKPLEDYSLGERIVATFIIVVVVLLLLALIGWISGGWEDVGAAPIDEPPIDPKYEEALLKLDRTAIEEAYRDQIQHLFQIWMKDDKGQPARALVGAKQARRAFIATIEGLERREQKLREMK
jgi:hypothetical protein